MILAMIGGQTNSETVKQVLNKIWGKYGTEESNSGRGDKDSN